MQNQRVKGVLRHMAEHGGTLLLAFLGVERLLSFGGYPLLSLAEARGKRDTAKKLIADGKDPSVQKKLDHIAAVTASRCTFLDLILVSRKNAASTAALSKPDIGPA